MKKEILILGIICLFIGLGIQPAFAVEISNNRPPSPPQIKGPQGRPPGTYKWTFKSFDPDDDNISYRVNWGDGGCEDWSKPYPSGEEVAYYHTYTEYGAYVITAQAKDTYDMLSNESTMDVTITKSKEPSGLLWGTYKDCTIYTKLWMEGQGHLESTRQILWDMFFGIDFLFFIRLPRTDCTLNGAEGKVKAKGVLGFGFSGFIQPQIDPRGEPGEIDGHLQFCIYRKVLFP